MEGQDVATVVSALIAVVGVLYGAYVTRLNVAKDREIAELRVAQELQIGYYSELLKERMVRYLDLWEEMRDLPKYPRLESLNYLQLDGLAVRLRDWYFKGGGGLFLSSPARETYFDLMDGLKVLLQKQRGEWAAAELPVGDLEAVRLYLERPPGWKPPSHLQTIIQSPVTPTDPNQPIPPELLERVRLLGSGVRSALARDVASRRQSYLEAGQQFEDL